MDIISYGIASKAEKQEQFTRNDVLGLGVEGSFPHVKGRIDNLEKAIQGVVAQADKLIVNDAINIMKAHAKLNAVAKSMKYKMYNMIFDDLLDLSGIDTTKSSGHIHDAVNGLLKSAGGNYVIVTKTETTDIIPSKVVFTVEENNTDIQGNYFISRDGGVTWEEITPDTLFYFKDSISPLDNKICIKAELPADTQLLSYALTWA
jgi:hypothetical protein